ncbi:MAG: TrkH family potassium uptake protein [Deltaproteobacteria bacterium]
MDLTEESQNIQIDRASNIVFLISVIGLIVLLFDFGFNQEWEVQIAINIYYFIVLVSGIFITVLRYLTQIKHIRIKVILFDIVTNIIILLIIGLHFFSSQAYKEATVFYSDDWLKLSILFTFVREFAVRKINFQRNYLNPAQLFVISFIAIIFGGALLLMLPNATVNGISFIDALFTSTSAVCVTGLIVVDTATFFTHFGQIIIMLLIQVGGLGILTFVSYFSYFFKGGSTFENHLVIKDMANVEKIGEVYKILKNVLVITLIIETIGAIMIYSSLNTDLLPTFYSRVFFSVFHSVSAFCNAGFSTLTNNLYEPGYEYNYSLHLSIVFLLVVGGLGFPIVSNSIYFLKYKFINLWAHLNNKPKIHKPRIVNLSTKIILFTTFSLILCGTLFIYLSEYNNAFKTHSEFGKIVSSLFAATTPRTAGFNTVNMASLTLPTILITMLLMWIGASPASTGGGIKTSTFAISMMNFVSLAKNKTRLELFRRQIPDTTIRRSYAIITLSILAIGSGIIIISVFDPDKGLTNIAFEAISAFGTVGLSLGVTAMLSVNSKIILILLMFTGRVGMISIIIALIRKEKYSNYRYPDEEIIIN